MILSTMTAVRKMRITNMARRNIWEQIWESTEGPTVTVTIPRDHAESLLKVLASSLEQDMPDDGMGDEDDDMDDMGDLDFGDGGDMQGPPEDDDMDLDMPAGDDGDDDDMFGDDEPKKKGPGRPPGVKNKKKDDDKKEKDDDSDDDTKEEGAGEYRPQTALGESAFSKLGRVLAKPSRRR